MKNNIKRLLLTLLLIALVSACTSDPVQTAEAISANVILNDVLIFTPDEGKAFGQAQKSALLGALANGKTQFMADQLTYSIEPLSEGSYRVFLLNPIAESLLGNLQPVGGNLLSEELTDAIQNALATETPTFVHAGKTYEITQNRKAAQISTRADAVIASTYYLEAYDSHYNEVISKHDFVLNLNLALQQGLRTFSHGGDEYGIVPVPGGYSITDPEVNLFAEYSNIYVVPKGGNEISLGFKNKVREAVETNQATFEYTDVTGQLTQYRVEPRENSWSIYKVPTQ